MNSLLSAKGLQRHQLARATGCHLETIRYYEKIGLLPDPPRSASPPSCLNTVNPKLSLLRARYRLTARIHAPRRSRG